MKHHLTVRRFVVAAVATGVVLGAPSAAAVAAATATPPDGDAQRIEFAPGADNATVEGEVAAGSAARYVLRAAAGQEMTIVVNSADGNAVLRLAGTDGGVLSAGLATVSTTLPADGDYIIEVSSTGGTATFVMTVQIYDSTVAPPGAGTIRRIEFATGTDNATVEGTVDDTTTARYVLWAAAGQTMSIAIDSVEENADLVVYDPTGAALVEGIGGFLLPVNGDYVIEVFSEGGTSTYGMNVLIPGAAATGTTERIEFAPGTNTASVTGDIAPGTANRYVLWAATGQTMVVHVSSVTANVSFSIYGPDGTPLANDQVQATVVLTADGDHAVVVESTSSGGPYRVSFWIE